MASHSHTPQPAPSPVESLEPESWKFVKLTFWTTKMEFWFRLVQSFSIRWFLLVPAVNFPGCTLVFLFTDVGVLFSLCSFNVYWCWKNTNQKWRVMIWLGFHTAVRVFVWACSCSWSRGLYFLSYKGLVSSPLSRFFVNEPIRISWFLQNGGVPCGEKLPSRLLVFCHQGLFVLFWQHTKHSTPCGNWGLRRHATMLDLEVLL